jgi:hypothetical protein
VSNHTTRTIAGLGSADDPVDRIAAFLASRGWDVTRHADRFTEAKRGGWTVVLRRWRLRADLQIERPDGVLVIPSLFGAEEVERACSLLGIERYDLWRRDLIDGLGDAA